MIFNLVVSGGGSGSGDLPWQTFVGNPLEFDAPKTHTLQSVTVGFEPIQDTSGGDPSPSHICPITGWTGVNVYRESAYDATANPTLSLSWQAEVGTVYGGTIDVTTGLLTVEKTSQTITGNDLNLSQNIQPEGNMWRLTLATSRPHPTSAYSDALCNSYKVVRSYSAVNNTNNSVALNNSAMGQILVRNDSFTTRQEIIDGLNASPIQLVYELATPLTYNLTAQQVQAIVGRNVMWTDCVSLTVQARGTNV